MSSAYFGFISIDYDILMFFVSFFRLSDKYKMNRIALRQSPCMIPICVINSVLMSLSKTNGHPWLLAKNRGVLSEKIAC